MASKARSKFKEMKLSDSQEPTTCDFYPLKMTADHRTEMYVKFAKIMLIFQGTVTEKRHHAVSELASKFKYAGRLVSESTYKKESVCSFTGFDIEDFYTYFKSRVKQSCEEGYNLIIIDQSMTNIFQMKYFYFLAQKMQYLVLPYPPVLDASERRDFVKTHAEEFTKFSQRKVEQPHYFKHLFCGWFLHDVDSSEMRDEASLYIQDCFDNIAEFSDLFSKVCKSDFKSYFNMIDKRQDLAFCTVKIFRNELDVKAYMSNPEFQESYGKMSKLYIVGFVISPHMVAARVRLTHHQRQLWDIDDYIDEKYEPDSFPTELMKKTKVDVKGEEVTLIASKSNRTIIVGDPICEPTKAIHSRSKGRSCHILLGKADNAPVKNVNYDVPFAITRESNVLHKYSDDLVPYDLNRCLVRRIGKYWIVYLKETIIVNGFFASCCALDAN